MMKCRYSVNEIDRIEKIFGFTEEDYHVLSNKA